MREVFGERGVVINYSLLLTSKKRHKFLTLASLTEYRYISSLRNVA